jgi:hypothetical protein
MLEIMGAFSIGVRIPVAPECLDKVLESPYRTEIISVVIVWALLLNALCI